MSSYSQLKTLAASLVDDVDAVIQELEQGDQALHDLIRRHDQQMEKAKEFASRAAEHQAKSDALALTVADLKAQLKHADLLMRNEKTYANSFIFKEGAAQRISKQVKSRITIRKEMLLRKEIDRRVNAIGKKIVRNSGFRRKGGGFDMIEDDGKLPGGRKNPNSLINKLEDNGPQEPSA